MWQTRLITRALCLCGGVGSEALNRSRGTGARAAVPVFPSAFLAGVGPFGPQRGNRPIGKGRAKSVKSAARPDAGFKTFARWITGAVLIAAVGLSWPSGANSFLITVTGLGGGNAGGVGRGWGAWRVAGEGRR